MANDKIEVEYSWGHELRHCESPPSMEGAYLLGVDVDELDVGKLTPTGLVWYDRYLDGKLG